MCDIWKVKSPLDTGWKPLEVWVLLNSLLLAALESISVSPHKQITRPPRRKGKGRNFLCSAAPLSQEKVTFNILPSRTFLVKPFSSPFLTSRNEANVAKQEAACRDFSFQTGQQECCSRQLFHLFDGSSLRFCFRSPQFWALRGIKESSRELTFVKYIPVYKMLSPAVTQTDAKGEGKVASGLKMLRAWRGSSDCREETSRERHKASLNPGQTCERHIQSATGQKREISKTRAPRCSWPKSLEFPILWVWFVKCFSWKDFLWGPNLNDNAPFFPLKLVSNLFSNRETLSPVFSALFWVTSMVMKPASPRPAGPGHGPVLKRGVPSTQAYV